MKILIVGGGGREHALAWKAAQSERVAEVLVAPGNAGTAAEEKVRNVPLADDAIDSLVSLAERERVALTIVGPEQPLVAGIVDRFEESGLRCFGPMAKAARLEGSKTFTKRFLARHSIPTARFESFHDLDAALGYARSQPLPLVIKADGLAAGKGVVVAETLAEAETALREMLADGKFGRAGAMVVVEEFLSGEEASFIAIVDGRQILAMASSQDHKTRDDGDLGPNTGGMGAYSPASVVDAATHGRIMNDIMVPTVNALADEGIPYRGFLYAGLMIDRRGRPKVLEFNCRFGDPETQPVMFRLESDLVDLCLRTFDGTLGDATARWHPGASVGVVMASRGYPGSYETGRDIMGLDAVENSDVKVFHAGTKVENGRIVTAGGRVLCVVARGETVGAARTLAYAAVGKIGWDGAFYRRDIGHRALAREKAARN